MARARSSAVPLALAFAALIAYASLYPFTDWRWPPGHELKQLMQLPWPRYFPHFDIFANLLGYFPLGALACGAAVRSGWRLLPALLVGMLAPAALSFVLEVTQNFLPERVPSLLDWLLNAGGALLGAVLALLLQATGQLARWQALRDRWFLGGSAGARALLLLWPVALLFPTPVPLGLGQVGDALRQLALAAVSGTPWAERAQDWLAPALDVPALTPLSEWFAVALGLLGPCLLAHSALRPGVRRIAVALATAAAGLATTTLSTVLSFGPAHAFTWLTPNTLPALGAALLAAVATAWLGRRMAAALALVALTALVALVAQAPADPYFAESLQGWQQGRFIRFHGLAQWVGWLWPYAAGVWLLMRVGARDPDSEGKP
jgi:VanZ family protein